MVNLNDTSGVLANQKDSSRILASQNDISRILFTEEQIKVRVKELAENIVDDYWGEELVVMTVMKGAFFFSHDLMVAMHNYSVKKHGDMLDIIPDTVQLSLFTDPDNPVIKPRYILGPDPNINYEKRNVLVIEDIVDRGYTMKVLFEHLQERKGQKPASISLCSLLTKPSQRKIEIPIDYCGFEVGNEFVVGYGLDYLQRYRLLPDIGVLKPEVYSKAA